MKKLCSIIIRTYNEERWIPHCLKAIFSQDYKNFEVIIVDNKSTDGTLKKVAQFDVAKVMECLDYLPGKALNIGARKAKGDYLVFLSGHCIPKNDHWLSYMILNFQDENVAGVYGRQEPLAFTPGSDKRDLAIIFGRDKRIQKKDNFFHNANSAIRMDLWKEEPFDENTISIEDRLWATKILKKGYTLIYEPDASVYHYHGIHQDGNEIRLANHVKILERLDIRLKKNLHVDIKNLNIIAIVPFKGNINDMDGLPLLKHTITATKQSKFIKKVIISTDSPETAKLSKELGAEVPFLRKELLSQDFIDIETVLQYSLDKIEDEGIYPDVIVYLEVTYPFRPPNLIDNAIVQLIESGLDTVIAGKKEFRSIWKKEQGNITRIDKEGTVPRKYKEPYYLEVKGLCSVTYPEFIRQGALYGTKIGLLEVSDPLSLVEIREKSQMDLANILLNYNIK